MACNFQPTAGRLVLPDATNGIDLIVGICCGRPGGWGSSFIHLMSGMRRGMGALVGPGTCGAGEAGGGETLLWQNRALTAWGGDGTG